MNVRRNEESRQFYTSLLSGQTLSENLSKWSSRILMSLEIPLDVRDSLPSLKNEF